MSKAAEKPAVSVTRSKATNNAPRVRSCTVRPPLSSTFDWHWSGMPASVGKGRFQENSLHRQLESDGQPSHDANVGLGLNAVEVVDDGKAHGHEARPVVFGEACDGAR